MRPNRPLSSKVESVSKQADTGRAIVFRYAQKFQPELDRAKFSSRVILVWRYKSESGMPVVEERKAMDWMEDELSPCVEKSGISLLALVSTGENLREWTYYAQSEEAFLSALNSALAGKPPFPIEIHVEPDASWSMYEEFRRGVRD
ncbi:DUF695 domain-containing protein [Variovorax sp. HJSM1_2]|uniref:DUF695 domain-containing protein n=1 Tax=Variovorax sp. HJSM1_2 TaxID=3366263 RepID=UPI003BE01DC6